MPFTPVVSRPISRTSCSWKRIDRPWRVASTMSFVPLVTCTSISSSPSSILIALMPVRAHVRVLRQRRLLHRALLGGEEQELIVGELAHRHDRRHLRVGRDVDQVDDRLALGRAARLRDLVHLEPEAAPVVGEAQHVVVRRRDEEVLDEILFLERRAVVTAPAAPLLLVRRDRRALDVAGVRDGDDHLLFGDQVLDRELALVARDLGAALVAVLLGDRRRARP